MAHIFHNSSTKTQQPGQWISTTWELRHRICENLTGHTCYCLGLDTCSYNHGKVVWRLLQFSFFNNPTTWITWEQKSQKGQNSIFMATLRSKCRHYILQLWLLSSSSFFLLFFPRLYSAAGDWMSTILPHMMWPKCKFTAGLKCAACGLLEI